MYPVYVENQEMCELFNQTPTFISMSRVEQANGNEILSFMIEGKVDEIWEFPAQKKTRVKKELKMLKTRQNERLQKRD